MPIYEYKCKDCGKDFDLLVNSSTEIKCKECGSKKLVKKMSAFGFSTGSTQPTCAEACCGGFNEGACGSGMCGGGM